ncbi:unnamed protein product [Protopolystoma xenopodis]|uniref:Uncharacterized protein n=1 Tax=Protopolystoma xenopodis TaxID=117903 RepID=A0A448WH36_9PLAT|nr:unnamed protein product [Protopolystoma xenopodis]
MLETATLIRAKCHTSVGFLPSPATVVPTSMASGSGLESLPLLDDDLLLLPAVPTDRLDNLDAAITPGADSETLAGGIDNCEAGVTVEEPQSPVFPDSSSSSTCSVVQYVTSAAATSKEEPEEVFADPGNTSGNLSTETNEALAAGAMGYVHVMRSL